MRLYNSLGTVTLSSALLGVTLLSLACGEAPSASPLGSAAAVASGAMPSASSGASAPASLPAPAPIQAELRARLDAGGSCKWNENGLMQSCDADAALRTYVEANRTPATLEGCLSALREEAPAIRVMGSACLYAYYFSLSDADAKPSVGRLFDLVLPAIEKETEPGVRAALASTIWQRDALSVGKGDAVVATLKKLDPARDGHAMSHMAASLHWFGMTEEPIKGLLDLAADYAAAPSPALRQDAYVVMGYAPSRADTFCPLLRKAVETDTERWTDALGALGLLDKACEKEAEATHAAVLKRLERAADPDHTSAEEIGSWGELRGYVNSGSRTPEQRAAVAVAAEKIARGTKTTKLHKGYASTLAADARAKREQK